MLWRKERNWAREVNYIVWIRQLAVCPIANVTLIRSSYVQYYRAVFSFVAYKVALVTKCAWNAIEIDRVRGTFSCQLFVTFASLKERGWRSG